MSLPFLSSIKNQYLKKARKIVTDNTALCRDDVAVVWRIFLGVETKYHSMWGSLNE